MENEIPDLDSLLIFNAPLHFCLSSNGTAVNIVSSTKYLGVIIDNELTFLDKLK